MAADRRRNILYFCLVLLILNFASTTTGAELYPYGSNAGDSSLSRTNDFAQVLNLQRAFPFGKKYSSTLYISDNGVLSFEDAVFVESDNPLYRNLPYYYDVDDDGINLEQPDSILPFWADIDISTSGGGNIFYRQVEDQTTLDRASEDVRQAFRSNPHFNAQNVIIVTWDQVSFYDQQGGNDPRNTFQAVLIHDGQESFVYFMYETITWTVGTKMGGDAATGLGSQGNALVGFQSNDGNTRNILYNTQSALLDLPSLSNLIDFNPGVFAYKVDGLDRIEPSCQSGPNAEFAITPARTGMMGGERIYLLGPCWDSAVTYTCVFSYLGTELQRVNATVESVNDAYCVPDPFFLVGEVQLAIESNGVSTTYKADYQLIENARVPQTVTRQSATSSYWETAGNSLTVTWNTFSGNNKVTITVLAYREDGSEGPRWDRVYTITNDTDDDGSYIFTPTAQDHVTEDNAFGVIRITANTEKRDQILWSDIHSLGYLLEEDYQENPTEWASEKCMAWQIDDDFKGNFDESIPACPCTYEQALQDTGVFITDPTCHEEETENCPMSDAVKACFLNAYATSDTNAGTRCCYNNNDLLIYSGDTKDAGTNSRSHIRGADPYLRQNLVPELSYWSNDLIAYHFCCEWGTDKDCFEYRQRRPTSDCVNYEPPTIALSYGDPHFLTMDRRNYTFNGLGEYTLLRYSSAANGMFDFELQGRLIRSKDFSDKHVDVTQVSAVAMKDQNSDTVFIEASPSSGMDVYRKNEDVWTSVYFSQQTFTEMQGVAIGVTNFQRDVEIYGLVVMFKTTGFAVEVNYDYGMLAVRPILQSDLNSDRLWGLLGNMNGDPDDDLRRRDNNAILSPDASEQEIFDFGKTWEIEVSDTLFLYPPNKDHSSYHNDTFQPLMNVELSVLYPACEDVEACLYDYEVSGNDPYMATATLGAYNDFIESEAAIQKIDSCPFIGTPYNGTKTYSSENNHYFEGAQLGFECDPDLILVGSSFRHCVYTEIEEEEVLAWTGKGEEYFCIMSSCGHLATPQNGSITLSVDEKTATFECDEGFTRDGSSQSVCNGNSWSNSPPSCIAGNPVNVAAIAAGVSIAVVVVILLIVLGILYYNKNKGSVKYSGDPKKASMPPEPVQKDPEVPPVDPVSGLDEAEPALNLALNTNDEEQAITKSETQTDSAAPPPVQPTAVPTVVPQTKTPEPQRPQQQLPPQPQPLRKESYHASATSGISHASHTSHATSVAPSVASSRPRDDVVTVKGTGLLKDTNISGSGGWI